MAQVLSIRGGIAPSPFAGVGENVIRAITCYAGQPTSVRRDGQTATAYPFTEQMRFTIAPPGRVPLRNTLFSLAEVPDLRALAALFPAGRLRSFAIPRVMDASLRRPFVFELAVHGNRPLGLSLVRALWSIDLRDCPGARRWAAAPRAAPLEGLRRAHAGVALPALGDLRSGRGRPLLLPRGNQPPAQGLVVR